MIGPGKYDDLCQYVMEKAEAKGAIVAVINGNKGFGFSCHLTLEDTIKLPLVLRTMADQIEEDMKNGKL